MVGEESVLGGGEGRCGVSVRGEGREGVCEGRVGRECVRGGWGGSVCGEGGEGVCVGEVNAVRVSEYRLDLGAWCVVRGERLSTSVCACTAYAMCDGCDKIS